MNLLRRNPVSTQTPEDALRRIKFVIAKIGKEPQHHATPAMVDLMLIARQIADGEPIDVDSKAVRELRKNYAEAAVVGWEHDAKPKIADLRELVRGSNAPSRDNPLGQPKRGGRYVLVIEEMTHADIKNHLPGFVPRCEFGDTFLQALPDNVWGAVENWFFRDVM